MKPVTTSIIMAATLTAAHVIANTYNNEVVNIEVSLLLFSGYYLLAYMALTVITKSQTSRASVMLMLVYVSYVVPSYIINGEHGNNIVAQIETSNYLYKSKTYPYNQNVRDHVFGPKYYGYTNGERQTKSRLHGAAKGLVGLSVIVSGEVLNSTKEAYEERFKK